MASCSRIPGQPAPSATSMTPAGAGTACRLTSAMRRASRAVSCQWSRSISPVSPSRPPPPMPPLSRRPFSSTITETLSRVIGRVSRRSGAFGAQDLDLLATRPPRWPRPAPRGGPDRGRRRRSRAGSRPSPGTAKSSIGLASPYSRTLVGRGAGDIVPPPSPTASRAVSTARFRAASRYLGGMGVAGGLAVDRAQAEAFGGVVACGLDPAVVERRSLRSAAVQGTTRRRRRRPSRGAARPAPLTWSSAVSNGRNGASVMGGDILGLAAQNDKSGALPQWICL